MNVFGLIGQIFKPAMEMIDNVHTSEEEKLQQKATLLELQVGFMGEALDYESEQLKAKAEIITAEAKADSWLTRSWRPITMLVFLGLVVCDSFGWLASPLAPQAWTLLQIGIGGYIVGRSAQGVATSVSTAMKKKDET
jgi:hypothetical protein